MLRIISAFVVVAVAATTAVAQQPRPSATDRAAVPFSDPDRPGALKVRLLEGSLRIKGSSRRDVLFTSSSQGGREVLRGRRQAETPPGMRRLTQPAGFGVEERDNEMSVSAGVNRQVDLDIEVPMKTRLEVSVVNGGGVTVDGVDSEMEINTVDGGITLTNVGGSVVAHAVDGRISATITRVAPQAPMAFTSLNGDIDVTLPPAVKANLRLRSDQGDVFTDFDVQLMASANASPTQRNGRAVRADVNRSIYGAVNGGGPDFELRTFDGNVYVRKGK
jgi:putative adhesin